MRWELRRALEQVARRIRQVRLWSLLALCWLAWSLAGLAAMAVLSKSGLGAIPRSFVVAWALSLLASAGLCAALALRSARDRRWVARRIEARHPELDAGLLAAVEEDEATTSDRLGFLQANVIREALDHRRSHDWDETVPTWRLRGSQLAHVLALSLLIVVAVGMAGQSRSDEARRSGRLALANAHGVQVDPGNTSIERGSTLLVVARFNDHVPPEASLVVMNEKGAAPVPARAMTRSLEDPTFAARVESVEADLSYRVEFEEKHTETYRVRVFEYPELKRADAKLRFPGYTSLEPKTVEDVRHVTAVEGTELTLLCHLNKDVATARLVDPSGKTLELKPAEGGEHLYSVTVTLDESRRYRVQLVDREKRANKLPAEIVVNVTKNRPPVVVMKQPTQDVRVSPVEELTLRAEADDDYGVVRHGLSYSLAGQEPKEVVLKAPALAPPLASAKTPAPASGKPAPIRKVKAEHVIDFEAMKAAPDQLVTYFFWAEDIGPDGMARRASGDMFFAEVRHFEEIFRQGEQPPSGSAENEGQQGGGGNAQRAEELAELQKQVINGTWTIIRRETGAKPSAKFADDVKTLKESQHAVIEQAEQLGEGLQDPRSKENLKRAVMHMKEAEARLGEATIASQRPALAAEQAAYQALLKLRAREFEVIRGNRRQRQGGGGGGGASQRQLEQLELSSDENRYEERSAAKAPENLTPREREQRENRQVLNRLRELAQRQTDLNDRLKELQSALEAAKEPQAREEIERQLKRLRDQQQQVLRDTDELRERMESEENRDRMAETRQGVEETREHVRQASEALEQNRLSQAVTEGSRAGRQLNELREDLRKKASDQFTESMTEMRNQARQLDEDQKRLSDQIDAWNNKPAHSLRDDADRQPVRKGLEQQRTKLDKLLEQMRQTVQEAEETEPLLAKGLYDTVKKAEEQTIPDALKVTEQLVDAGVPEDAAKTSRLAGKGLEQLRAGVERAAEGVLGDETAALRRAQGELEQLADQVNREIAQATGTDRPGQGNDPSRRPSQPGRGGPNTKGQPRPGEGPQQAGDGQDGREDPQGAQEGRQGQDAQPKGQTPQQGGRRNPQGQQQRRQGQGQPGEQEAQPEPGQPGAEGQDADATNPQGPPGQPGQQGRQGQQRGQQGRQGGRPGQQGDQQGQDGQQPGQGDRPGQEGQPGQQGGQPGQEGQPGDQPGQEGQQGQQGGQPGQGGQGQGGQGGQQAGGGLRGNNTRGGAQGPGGGGGGASELDQMLRGIPSGPAGPITGEGFREWSDRLRDVEELLEDPEMRSEAARIRDRARGAREDFKRHSKMPDWTKLKGMVADPIRELQNRVAEEVRRRESPDALVPIDRDPVPPQFTEGVRRYYERLGSGL